MSRKQAPKIAANPMIRDGESTFQAIMRQFWKNLVSLVSSTRIKRRARRMEVVDRVSIGAKQSVLLLRLDQQEFVVGCSGENLVLLGTREMENEVVQLPALAEKKASAPRKRRVRTMKPPSAAELLREFQGSIQ